MEVQVQQNAITLSVTWTNGGETPGKTHVFPYVWLRDNCQCRKVCWNPTGEQTKPEGRLNLDVEVKPVRVDVLSTKPSDFDIQWSDGHTSRFESSWLRQYKFSISAVDPVLDPVMKPWGADVKIKRFDYQELVTSDEVLRNWLLELKQVGMALIKDTPLKEGQLKYIGERVSFLQPSHYGDIFKVQTRTNVKDRGNVAYQSGYLPLHTDMSYYMRPHGIMMLHCLEQVGEGGDNIFADGYKVAREIEKTNPDAFKALTTTTFEYFDIGNQTDYHMKYYQLSRHPVVQLNSRGNIERICYSPHARDAMLRMPVSDVLPAYRALKVFTDHLYHEDNLIKYKLEEGDIICLNNHRVLHGRTDFTITDTTARHLEGAYLDWDQANSRLRILLRNNHSTNNS